MKFIRIILTILLTISLQAQTVFYVDATNGDDSYNGTSEITAWQTIEKVNDEMNTFIAGDEILFKRGEIWNNPNSIRLYIENLLGTSILPIVFGAYGSGEKPIISSVVSQSHSWTNILGSNIWKVNNPPTDNPNRLLVNGEEKLRANTESELDGITFFWRYDIDTHNLFIHSTVNPNSLNVLYSTDFPIIIGETSYITIQDLDIQGGWTGIFINTLSNNIHIKNLDIGKYSGNGIVLNTGSTIQSNYPQNILIEDCNFDSGFTLDYSSANEYTGSFDRGVGDGFRAEALINGEVKNCYFKNWGHASFSLNGGVNIKVSNVSCNNNYMTSPDICYGGRINIDDATHNEIFNNQIINTSVQSQMNGQFNHYHHNIFEGTRNTPLLSNEFGVGVSISAYANTSLNGNIYENNLIMNTEGAGIQISGNNEYDIFNNIIRNNIVLNCGTTTGNKGLEVEENEYEETYNNSFLNNLVFSTATTQTCNFRGITYSVSNFNALSGTDGYIITNNLTGNPLFVDELNADYHLTENSPCINAGTTLLATQDYEDNTVPYTETLPDIGIYEYQPVVSVSEFQHKKFTIYPNPAKDFISISDTYSNSDYQIISITGIIIKKGKLNNPKIDISKINNGVYFLKLVDRNVVVEFIINR